MDPHFGKDDRTLTEAGDIHSLGVSTLAWLIFAAAAFVVGAIVADGAHPALGLTFRAKTSRVIDGDTIDCVVSWPMRLRLTHWSPEITGVEKPQGLQAKAALEKIIPPGSAIVVSVDSADASRLGDLLTFGRVVAGVWPEGSEQSVSQIMVSAGHGTWEKP